MITKAPGFLSACAPLWLGQTALTLSVGGEKDAEAAPPAGLVRPHADDAQRGDQHDVVGHCGAELALQVLHRAATRRDLENIKSNKMAG